MDIQSRVVNYYKNNQFIQKYLKGIDSKTNELVVTFNNEDRRISIDLLENIKSEDDLISALNGNTINAVPVAEEVAPEIPEVPVMEQVAEPVVSSPEPVVSAPVMPEVPAMEPVADPVVSNPEPVAAPVMPEAPTMEPAPSPVVNNPTPIVPESREQVMLTTQEDLSRESLNDIKILVELKNKDGLNNVLKKYAVNPSTGLIDINQAISTVTQNTMNEVIQSIKNNYEFDSNLSNYEIDGKYIGNPIIATSSEDERIVQSFGNIKLFLDASKMYPEQVNYNDEQINNFMKTYIDKVKAELSGGAAPAVQSNPEPVVAGPVVNNNQPNEVPVSASAGFADIFVLTVIVLVYAVIIVNLIIRLK